MSGVSIRIDGNTAALSVLGGIAQRARNPRGMWDNIGAYLETATQRRFEQGAGPGGGKWPESYRAKFYGGKTLVDTARLLNSITHNASDSGVIVGTNVIYAAIHQFGGTIRAKTDKGLFVQFGAKGKTAKTRRGKTAGGKWRGEIRRPMSVTLPARPFLGIDTDDESEILHIAANWILPGGGDAG